VLAARDRLGTGWKPYVLDVRGASEADIVRLEWADRLQPHSQVADIANELPRDRDILIHCKMGGRSAKACATLAELGFASERLFNLDGGIVGWAEQVDPTLPTY
jgi:rhodanese-related sulfurtransferase